MSIVFKVAATAKSCGKVSHAAVKSFDRRGVSCKNGRTVQFSGGVDKCPACSSSSSSSSSNNNNDYNKIVVSYSVIQ